MANALNSWTGALFALFVTANLANAQSLVDKHPTYRQHAEGFFVDKIEYRDNETVVHFRYAGNEYSSATFYQPKHNLAWFLRDESGKVYELKSLKNLAKDGNVLHKEVIETTYLSTDWQTSTKSKMEATCELHFEKLAAGVKKVDLVEGLGREAWSNHFNAFDIQVKTQDKIAQEEANPALTENNITKPVVVAEEVYAFEEDWDLQMNDFNMEEVDETELGGMGYREIEDLEQELLIENFDLEDYNPAYDYEAELAAAKQAIEDSKAPAYELSDMVKTQKRVKYDEKQTRKQYTLDKIEYREKDMVVFFSFEDQGYPSGTFYGVDGEHTWFLRDEAGNVYKSKAVNDLRYNNQPLVEGIKTQIRVADMLGDNASFDFKDYKKKNTSSCQIIFDRLPNTAKVVDLIEGEGREAYSNHFNVFDIHLKTFRTPAEAPVVEPTVEPAVVAEASNQNNLDKPAAVANYSIFPNPNKGAFNLLNNGVAQKEAFVQVLDLSGKVLLSQQVQIDEKASQKFDIKNLSAGQYLVRIQNTDKTVETLQMIVAE